ncbi:MAG: restriction endonuclease subunit S [Phycisphaerae bacterium]
MLVDENAADARYLFYALKHTRLDLLQRCVGGAQRNLSGTFVREHHIPVPPLAEQQHSYRECGPLPLCGGVTVANLRSHQEKSQKSIVGSKPHGISDAFKLRELGLSALEF